MTATRDVRARIALDGEKEFKEALKGLSKENSLLNAEMRKLQEQYKGNENSTEALQEKGKILNEQLEVQRKRLAELRKALDEASSAAERDENKILDLKTKLTNAETQELKLTHSIEENNQALENNGKQMVSLGDVADQLAGKLGVKLPDGAKKALDGMTSMSAGSVAALTAITAAVAVTLKAIKGLHEMTLEAAADMDELITQSMISGVSIEALQKWEYAAEFVDVPLSTMTGSLTKLTKTMADARDGTGTAAEAFAQLGIAVTDSNGNLRDSEDVFGEVIDRLGNISNETERDALAMELLGKSAQELNPLILAGSDALREYGEEAEDLGYVLSIDQVEALAAVDDAYQRYMLTVEAAKKQLAADFAPASQAAMETFQHAVELAAKTLTESHIIENLGHVIQGIMGILDSGMSLFDNLPSWVNPLNKVSAAFKGLALVLSMVTDGIKIFLGMWPAFWGTGMLKEGLGISGYNNIQKTLGYAGTGEAISYDNPGWGYDPSGRAYDLATGNYIYNAPGTDYWRGGMTWVGENGPELVSLPRGSSIMSASESAGAMGAQYITINVQGIEQLDEVVRWYEARRITERMR